MGVRTTSWGGPLWHASFCMAINYDHHPSPHKDQLYLDYFDLLGQMLPCLFCRQYYEQCKLVLPLQDYLNNPLLEQPVMYWLYNLKDLVNKKLMRQEAECYSNVVRKIDDDVTLSTRAKAARKQEMKYKIFYTTPSPPFEDVLAFYQSLTSTCESNAMNKSLQSCRHL